VPCKTHGITLLLALQYNLHLYITYLQVMVDEPVKYMTTVCMAWVWLPAEKWKILFFKDTCLTSNRYHGLDLWVNVAAV